MSTKSSTRFSAGDFMLLVVAGFWGATYLVVKDLGNAGSIGGMMAIRFVIAAAALWLYWLYKRDRFQKQEWIMGIAFGISQTVVLNLEAYSVHFTSATNGGLIIALAIITVPILESAWRKNWLPYKFFIATSVALIGLFMLIMGNGFVEPNIGDLLMFIAMILRTFHFVILGRLTQGKSYSPVNLTTVMVSTSGLIMFLYNPADAFNTAANYNVPSSSLHVIRIHRHELGGEAHVGFQSQFATGNRTGLGNYSRRDYRQRTYWPIGCHRRSDGYWSHLLGSVNRNET
jgi:drug/metabolite transporter (DMT)-like permease